MEFLSRFIKGNMTFCAKSFPVTNITFIFPRYVCPFKFFGNLRATILTNFRSAKSSSDPDMYTPISYLISYPKMMFFSFWNDKIISETFLGTIFSASRGLCDKFFFTSRTYFFNTISMKHISTFLGTKFPSSNSDSLWKCLKFFIAKCAVNNHFYFFSSMNISYFYLNSNKTILIEQ